MRSGTSARVAAALTITTMVTACADTSNVTTTTSTNTSTAISTTTGPTVATTAATTNDVSVDASAVDTSVDAPVDDGQPPARLDPELVDELDVEGFAALLSASYALMSDPSAPPADREGAGVDHQLVLRELAARPDLDEAVLDAVHPDALPSVERTVRARQFLQARSASRPAQPLPDELPAWTIVDPEPVDVLIGHYADAERLTGIPWYWLAAIHLQETRMGRIDGVSASGAVGPMQFLPTTWEVCCTGDPTDTRDAIIGAATYLAQSGGPDDMAAAVHEYNPNDGYVAVVTAYAESLRDDPESYPGYHAFQVFVGTSAGTVRLPVGYSESSPVDAASYVKANPDDAA